MRPKPKPWFPSWNDISKNEHTVNSQLIILKKTVIGLADAIMQESAMDIWSIGHILTINVNEQLSGGRDDTLKMRENCKLLTWSMIALAEKKTFTAHVIVQRLNVWKYIKPW